VALRAGGGWLRGLLGPALLAALVLAAFSPLRHNDFVDYDDNAYLTRNPAVQGGLGAASLRWAFTTTRGSNWHPLTWVSHLADVSLFGLDPRGHHLVNLLLHAANTLLLFLLLRSLTGEPWPSAAAAALFGVHPLHVEAVAWAAERKELLAAFFGLLALHSYRRAVSRPGGPRLAPAALLLALGLLAKPTLVSLPFVLLLLDFWPLRRTAAGAAPGAPALPWRRLAAEKLPLFALAAASCLVTYRVQGGAAAMLQHLPAATRLSNAVVAAAAYLGRTLWPARLAFFYPHPERPWPATTFAAALATLLLLTGAAAALRRRAPWLAVGWLWFLGMLVPTVGLVQVGWQARADRYTYLPLIGVFTAAAWGTVRWSRRARQGPLVAAAAAALLLAAAAQTRAQVATWRDTETLFRHAVAVTTDNWLAHQNLGAYLIARQRTEEGLRQEREALRIKPGAADAWYNLGCGLLARGEGEPAAEAFRAAIRLKPADPDFHVNLGTALFALGRREEAACSYERALRLDPALAASRRGAEIARRAGATPHAPCP
jgi:hypothetical protein